MEDKYLEYAIPFKEDQKDIFIAWLGFFDFEMILEEETVLKAYVNTVVQEAPDTLALAEKLQIAIGDIKVSEIENKNWNADWESNFSPVSIPDKCHVRASFHPLSGAFPFEIVIAPKMAFGTGHHATTYMMLDKMYDLDITNKTVFDYGCGTGILSVFAAMKGAKNIWSVDIEERAVENTIEHFELNEISQAQLIVKQGDIDLIQEEESFDLILANINRNVLLENVASICKHMSPQTDLLISGVLETDKETVLDHYSKHHLKVIDLNQRGEWLCIHFQKINNSL